MDQKPHTAIFGISPVRNDIPTHEGALRRGDNWQALIAQEPKESMPFALSLYKRGEQLMRQIALNVLEESKTNPHILHRHGLCPEAIAERYRLKLPTAADLGKREWLIPSPEECKEYGAPPPAPPAADNTPQAAETVSTENPSSTEGITVEGNNPHKYMASKTYAPSAGLTRPSVNLKDVVKSEHGATPPDTSAPGKPPSAPLDLSPVSEEEMRKLTDAFTQERPKKQRTLDRIENAKQAFDIKFRNLGAEKLQEEVRNQVDTNLHAIYELCASYVKSMHTDDIGAATPTLVSMLELAQRTSMLIGSQGKFAQHTARSLMKESLNEALDYLSFRELQTIGDPVEKLKFAEKIQGHLRLFLSSEQKLGMSH